MTELAHSYAEIIKQEKLEDGTLRVYGKATDDSLDVDQQICDADWLKRAMPDWFTSGGNIREQHSNIAAGVATEYEEKDDGHYITALVVDPTSVKKVETRVLKGFSIGIRGPRVVRDTKAAGGRIIDGQIVEVSLVDRPANPNAKLMLAKASDTGELMSVKQIDIPLPNEVFKNDEPALPEPEVKEELAVEEPAVTPAEEVVEETVDEKAAKISELVNNAKALQATLAKFDQALYDNAIAALADLIVVEANEMKEGSNEVESLCHLLDSVKHLFAWYAGEAADGEVPDANPALTEAPEQEMELEINLSANPEEPELVEEETTEVTEEQGEAEDLAAALEAEREKTAKLEAELEAAKALSVGGGPKRTTINKSSSVNVDGLLQKAAELRIKARATADRVLAKGYSAWADELEAQARKGED